MIDSKIGEPIASAPEAAAAPTSPATRTAAMDLVRRMSYWSAGAGAIPLPVIDVAAVIGVQVKMLRDLARLYNVPFDEVRAKSVIGALIGGVLPFHAAAGVAGLFGVLAKSWPGFGTLAGGLALLAAAGAATYALGKVFVEHFESGGTLLDFDADKMRARFRAEMEAARATGRAEA
jgi:uncharacterized protein (DUF697 family)